MRATEFLPESITPTDQINRVRRILQSECSKALASFPRPLWRGIKAEGTNPLRRFDTVPNRAPLDMSTAAHRIADDWFLENFGYRFRSNHVAFASSDIRVANGYGTACLFYPIGDFDCCAAEGIEDLVDEVARLDISTPDPLRDRLVAGEYDTGRAALDIAFKTGNEIMIACEEYYVIYPGHYTFGLGPKNIKDSGAYLHTSFRMSI